jgi:hypothetical protein
LLLLARLLCSPPSNDDSAVMMSPVRIVSASASASACRSACRLHSCARWPAALLTSTTLPPVMSADHSSNTLPHQARESGRVQTTAASPTLSRSNASCEMSSPPTAILDMQTALQVQQARTHLIIPWLVHLAAACMILCLLAGARRTLLITLPHCASLSLTSQSRSREESSSSSSCNDNFGSQ